MPASATRLVLRTRAIRDAAGRAVRPCTLDRSRSRPPARCAPRNARSRSPRCVVPVCRRVAGGEARGREFRDSVRRARRHNYSDRHRAQRPLDAPRPGCVARAGASPDRATLPGQSPPLPISARAVLLADRPLAPFSRPLRHSEFLLFERRDQQLHRFQVQFTQRLARRLPSHQRLRALDQLHMLFSRTELHLVLLWTSHGRPRQPRTFYTRWRGGR